MPAGDVKATVYHSTPRLLTGVRMQVTEPLSWRQLTEGSSSIPYDSVTRYVLVDQDGAERGYGGKSAWDHTKAVSRDVTFVYDQSGDEVVAKRVTYVLQLHTNALSSAGYNVTDSSVTAAQITGAAPFSTASTTDVTTSLADSVITLTGTVDYPAPGEHVVTAVALNANDTDREVGRSSVSVEDEGSVTVDPPEVAGMRFVMWRGLPDSATVADDGTVSIAGVISGLELKAIYEPLVSAVSFAVATPEVGGEFPTSISDVDISDADGTALGARDASVSWTGPDGTAATEVEPGCTYTATVSMTVLGEDGYAFGLADSVDATVNGLAPDSVAANKDERSVVVTYRVTTPSDKGYDSLVTDLSDVDITHVDEVSGNLPGTAVFKLRDGTFESAKLSWDTDSLPYGLRSGSFAVQGFFTYDGETHRVSRTFDLKMLDEPVASLKGGDYEGAQRVSLRAADEWLGRTATIYYCLLPAGSTTDPDSISPADCEVYDGTPVTVDSDCVMVGFAAVGDPDLGTRKTAVARVEYSIATHAIKVASGTAANADGEPVDSAIKGAKITVTADEPAEGMVFSGWRVVSSDAALADSSSATTTLVMPAGDVELEATYARRADPSPDPDPDDPDDSDHGGSGGEVAPADADGAATVVPETGDPTNNLVAALVVGAGAVAVVVALVLRQRR